MKSNKSNLAIKEASSRGYKITLTGDIINPKGDVIKGTIGHDGYKRFILRIKGSGMYHVKVHRLAAFQKFGDMIFESKKLVRHLNDKKLDNSFSNIAMGSASDNMMDIPESKRNEKACHAATFIKKHDYVAEDVMKGIKKQGSLVPMSLVLGLSFYLTTEKNHSVEKVRHFFIQVVNGHPIENETIATLRNKMIEAKTKRERFNREDHLVYLKKTWNHFIQGTEVSKFYITPTDRERDFI